MEPNLLKFEFVRYLRGQPLGNSQGRTKTWNPNLNPIHYVQILKSRQTNQKLILPIWHSLPLPILAISTSPRHLLINNICRYIITRNGYLATGD
jgi:hypothetical protein